MKKLITLGTVLLALSTSAFANNEYKEVEDRYEANNNLAKIQVGSFYGEAGMSASFQKVLDTNFNDESMNYTKVSIEIGSNKKDIDSAFASYNIQVGFNPFYRDYLYDRTFLNYYKTAVTFVADVKGTTFEADDNERKKGLLVGGGISYSNPYKVHELNLIARTGLNSDIKSEFEANYRIGLSNDINFTVSALRTNTDTKDYNTIKGGLEFKF